MNIQKLIALTDLAKSGAFTETEISKMVHAMLGTAVIPEATLVFPEPAHLRLGYAESVHAAIALAKPGLDAPTWVLDGKVYTCVATIVDLMGCKAATAFGKLCAKLRADGKMLTTTGHFAPTDEGPLYLAKKVFTRETNYAALEDLTEASRTCFPLKFKALASLGAGPRPEARPLLRAVA